MSKHYTVYITSQHNCNHKSPVTYVHAVEEILHAEVKLVRNIGTTPAWSQFIYSNLLEIFFKLLNCLAVWNGYIMNKDNESYC